MKHNWRQMPPAKEIRVRLWHCAGCDMVVGVSDYLNENLHEFLDKCRYPEDCETAVVRYVLEQ